MSGFLSRRRFLAVAALGAAACRSSASRREGPDADVVIVGAGLAGLAAAHRLLATGFSVVVLEAGQRVGGRVLTLREPFQDGQFAEAGAIYVPGSHAVTRRYVEEFGLTLVPAFRGTPRTGLHLRGRLLGGGEEDLGLELRDDERAQGRRGLFRRYVLAGFDELGELDGADVDTDLLRQLDQRSFADLLRERGASEAAVELLGLGFFGIIGDGIESVSALQVLRELAGGGLDSQRIHGGSSRLPEAMAEALAPVLRRGAEVRAIVRRGPDLCVRFTEAAAARELVARHVILTLPTPVLRTLGFPADLSLSKRRAIDEVGSTSVTRTYLQCARRFWLPFASIDVDRPPLRLADATAGQPGDAGILEAYATGASARMLATRSEDQRVAELRGRAEQLFPGSADSFGEGASWCWDLDPLARGGYSWFRPGQLSGHLTALRASEGSMHFAGEHTSAWSGWMQGALESGERVAGEVERASRGRSAGGG